MRYLLLMCIFCFLPLQAFAEVKLIELQHRAPAELLSQVRGLLDKNEKVQAAGNHLILIADGESLLAAEKLIALLDVPQVNLLIQVRQTAELQRAGKEIAASIHYGNSSGLSTAAGTGFRYGNSTATQEQTLRLVVGGRGLIEVGREIPFTEQWSAVTGDISGYAEKTAYKTIATGFWVYPLRLLGDKVLVEIEPYIGDAESTAEHDPPRINYSQLQTRLLVPLAQWYPLGSQLRQRDKLSRAIVSWHSSNGQAERELQIRIELAD